ncbi:hypothetical protein HDV05_005872 [Chytridiales sp. JEL 0842]|nr:hypothetical protein HDV05_005872 [Chytridiales sp. JEL 0842]
MYTPPPPPGRSGTGGGTLLFEWFELGFDEARPVTVDDTETGRVTILNGLDAELDVGGRLEGGGGGGVAVLVVGDLSRGLEEGVVKDEVDGFDAFGGFGGGAALDDGRSESEDRETDEELRADLYRGGVDELPVPVSLPNEEWGGE